jgi:hypothetical protein
MSETAEATVTPVTPPIEESLAAAVPPTEITPPALTPPAQEAFTSTTVSAAVPEAPANNTQPDIAPANKGLIGKLMGILGIK